MGVVVHVDCLELTELFSVNGMQSPLGKGRKKDQKCSLGPSQKGSVC